MKKKYTRRNKKTLQKKIAERMPRGGFDQYTIMSAFLRSLRELYPRDKTAPGIVTACLGRDQWYASAVRYEETYGAGKQVLYSATASSLEKAIASIIEQWRDGTKVVRKFRKGVVEPVSEMDFASNMEEWGN